MRAWWLVSVAWLACVPRVPVQRVPTRVAAPVGLVFETSAQSGPAAIPPGVVEALGRELDERNVTVAAVTEGLASRQLSDSRFAALKAGAADAPIWVLIEMRPQFFSQLDGRYRWEVGTRITVERRDGRRAADSFTVPVVLMFEHERGAEALAAAAADIAGQVGRQLDAVLFDERPSGPQTLAPQKPHALYFAMVDRFADGDTSNNGTVNAADPQAFHGGDLDGLRQRQPWLQSLGVDAVWLSPVNSMRTEPWHGYGAFHGYWPYDVNSIEPRFGSLEALRRLSSELHAHQQQLIVDYVVNHVGPDAPLLTAHPDWFHHLGGITDWSSREQLETHDVHGLPDFDVERPDVFAYLLEGALKWLREADADGLRLDAVKHVPATFWAKFTNEIKRQAGRPRLLIGEYFSGDPSQIAEAWRAGGFTAMFDFPLGAAMTNVFCKGAPVTQLASVLSSDRVYPDVDGLVTLLDNHDLPRVMSVCGGDVEKVTQALTFMTAVRGIPSITWGTEVGSVGLTEPENRASMRFDDTAVLKARIAELLARRKASPALTRGTSELVAADAHHLLIRRVADREVSWVCVNQSAQTWQVSGQSCAPGVTVRQAREEGAPSPTAASTVRVRFVSRVPSARLVGSGPELGQWQPAKSLPLPVEVDLPVHSAFEFKWLTLAQDGSPTWSPHENQFLFVEPTTELQVVDVR